GGRQAGARPVQVVLLDVRQDVERPAAGLAAVVAPVRVADPAPPPAAGREALPGGLVVVAGQADLFEGIHALATAGRAPRAACPPDMSRPMRAAMMAITTSNSISVNAGRPALRPRTKGEERRQRMMHPPTGLTGS